MGQRSQHYVQFCTHKKNEFLGTHEKNLSAFHLQWCYGWFMIERMYNLLKYIKKNEELYKENEYRTFTGERYEEARKIRKEIYALTQFNFEGASFQIGSDLVKEQLEFNYADKHRDKNGEKVWYKDNFEEWLNWDRETKTKEDTKYKINPFCQDNNDGITVIKIEEDGTIKYAFDLLDGCNDETFRPITAKDYYKVYRKYDSDRLSDKDKRMIRNKIKYIDENFTLLTADEMKEIFNQEYEW